MPLYPFILLAVLFLAIIIVPPLLGAYLDYRRELSRERQATGSGSPRSEEQRG
jgi:hypothetical protein